MWRVLKELEIELPYDPVILLLGKYLKGSKPANYTGTYTPVFIAEVFTIARKLNQPRGPSIDG